MKNLIKNEWLQRHRDSRLKWLLIFLLLLWMSISIIIPRISANVAENIYPLTTNYAFKKQVAQSINRSLDRHNSKGERASKIEKEMLDLQVENLDLAWSFPHVILENVWLLFWGIGLLAMVLFISRKQPYL